MYNHRGKFMSNIPCKNCITFAICNSQISDEDPFYDVVINLIPKCSLIEKYIEYNKHLFSSELIIRVVLFFKPKESYELLMLREGDSSV